MALTQPTASALAGTQLGRYTLLGKLAMGGMAEVFLARQEGPKGFAKTVVIKRILPQYANDQEFLEMFLDEARLAALINHPHVVQIFELGEDSENQAYYIAMEYIDGRNLKQVATRALELGSQISMRVAARIIADAASGLEFAHALKDAHAEPLHIVHRDISAENILMSYGGMVKVVDFGIAKAASVEGRTKTGQVKGKYGYMSPEQLLGQSVDQRSDIWALGITLYWLLSGQRPFRGESEGRIIQQVVSADLPRLQRRGTPVPRELEDIVRTALEKNPGKRFQTAGELQEALDRWILSNGDPVTSAALSGLMEQLFPESTDKDRVLTRALLQGEIKSQDTPWQSRLAKQRKSGSQMVDTPPEPSRTPRWIAPLGGALAGLVAVVGVGFGWQALHKDDALPAVTHRTAVPDVPNAEPSAPPVRPPDAVPETKTAVPIPAPTVAPPAQAAEPAAAERHRSRPHRSAAEAEEERRPSGPPGFLDVETRPWASVIVDGRRIGTTPMATVSLPAGKHRIELVNEDLGAHLVRTVEVKSGETAKLREKMVAGGSE